jgi:hypothetical protein
MPAQEERERATCWGVMTEPKASCVDAGTRRGDAAQERRELRWRIVKVLHSN